MSDGPAFEATIWYVTDVPGVAVEGVSVLVIDRSAIRASVSVSVALLPAGAGSVVPAGAVTVAVLTRSDVVAGDNVPVSVKVAVAPTSNDTDALTSPVPVAGHDPTPAAEHVHVPPVSDAGNTSATVAPTTFDGPAF